MPRYKRSAAEAQLDVSVVEDAVPRDPAQAEKLQSLRNMWEFASLMQYIYMFGHVVKIDEDFDIEDLEHECLLPASSERLAQIGLSLLKYVSSHRGLTLENAAEYTRRQYLAKAPARNPFGDEEDPTPFNDLDIFTRIRVLHQLSTWTLGNADRFRGLMPEDDDHTDWRMEPLGWDKEDRAYFVLDDNRLYRRTDQPVPPPTPKVKAKSKPVSKKKKKGTPAPSRATRASKRRRIEDTPEDEEDEVAEDEAADITGDNDTVMIDGGETAATEEDEPGFGFTSKTWECVAVTLAEYQEFLSTIQRTKDRNERQLRQRLEDEVLPVIEKRAEALRQKQLRKLRDLENLEKLATAKRSSRLADKADKVAKEKEEREADEKKARDLKMALDEQDKQRRIEEGHESRRLTREQRLKEREVKRILHEEELSRLEREASIADATSSQVDPTSATNGTSDRKRLSSRNLQNQKESHKKELDRLTQDIQGYEDSWYFDCAVCGIHGENLDDGSHSVACERCDVWQHSKCHGFTPEQSEREDFIFVCASCRKKENAAKEQRSGVVLKLGKRGASGSPVVERNELNTAQSAPTPAPIIMAPIPSYPQGNGPALAQTATPHASFTGARPGHSHAHPQSPPSAVQLPPSAQNFRPPQQPWQGSSLPPLTHPVTPSYGNATPQAQRGNTVGHASPQQNHVNQHNWYHYNAVQSAGGHPPYNNAQQTQARPSSQGGTQGQYGNTFNGTRQQTVPFSQHHQAQTQAQQPHAGHAQYQHLQRPSSQGHHTNGVPGMSPSKSPLPQGSSPPAQFPPSTVHQQQTPQHPQTYTQHPMFPSSPQTSFPPPSTGYQQQAAFSPTKSSPPQLSAPSAATPSHVPVKPMQLGNATAGTLTNGHTPSSTPATGASTAIPKQASPNTSFEDAPKLAIPGRAAGNPAPPSANANGVSADGMSGPWPQGSLAVPRKSDFPTAPPTQ